MSRFVVGADTDGGFYVEDTSLDPPVKLAMGIKDYDAAQQIKNTLNTYEKVLSLYNYFNRDLTNVVLHKDS